MQPPSISVNIADNRFVLVEWTAPYDGSDAITEYKVLFQSKDKTFYTTTECESKVPTLATSCLVSMAGLMQAPFLLQYNQIVKAIV